MINSRCCLAPALTLLAAGSTQLSAQSLTSTINVGLTGLRVQASDPLLSPVDTTLAPLTPIANGFRLEAIVVGGVSRSTTQVLIAQDPLRITIEESAVAAPFNSGGGSAQCGSHDLWVTLLPTRDYSGDLVLTWNGIEQNDGVGSLLAEVDVDRDTTIDFRGVQGETRNARFPRSFGPSAPLLIRTTTFAEADGAVTSAFKSSLVIEFEPDSSTVSPGAVRPFGWGCAGSNGIAPLLTSVDSVGPLVGETFTAEVQSVPTAATSMFGFIGFASIAPFHLDVIGMDFCFLFIEPIVTLPLALPTFGATTANWDLAVPNETSFIGTSFFQQAYIADQFANSFGAILTNPLEATVGGN